MTTSARFALALLAVSVGSLAAAAPPVPDAGARARPPATADAGVELRFAVIGDFGSGEQQETDVAKLVKSWSPEFVVTTGDNNYPNGAAETLDAHVGRDYASFIGGYDGGFGPGSATNRFWPVPGNHDWRADQLRPYLDYFHLPGNGRYYEVDLGLVHLFMLDFDKHEPDGITADSVQGQWLKARLAASKSCFNLVVGHQAPYSSGLRHGSDAKLRWPFAKWGADAVLVGHEHLYERLDIGGVPYFVNGIGGDSRYEFAIPLPESKVRYRDNYGAMRVTATSAGVTYEFIDVKGVKVDSLNVPKQCAGR